jgi:hypothetical protein
MNRYLMMLMLWSVNGLSQDLVINEVLFNPAKEGFDYVEGYNKGSSDIDLQQISIANRNSSGEIAAEKKLSKESLVIPAGKYFVITSNEKWLRQHYMLPADVIICAITALPSFPDDEGTVVFLHNETIIDELHYSDKWHFKLISETEGVALERINYNEPTQDKNNWTSASSSSGYGTPGFQNSCFRADLRAEGEVTIYPKLISPDNNGNADFATIQFTLSEPGYLANSIVYDMSGRRVKYLLKNELLGMNSKFIWHREDDKLNMCGSGIYIVVTEIFNLQGKTRKFKHSIIIHH